MNSIKSLRPHDIVILLKIVTIEENDWYMKDVADSLFISRSEVSESLKRSVLSGFISENKRKIFTSALLEFLVHGIKYVYPQVPGGIKRGILTAHSASPLNQIISSDQIYVWPYAKGDKRGISIEPLFSSVPRACLEDIKLYELLALVDAIRVGSIREKNIAEKELKKRIL